MRQQIDLSCFYDGETNTKHCGLHESWSGTMLLYLVGLFVAGAVYIHKMLWW